MFYSQYGYYKKQGDWAQELCAPHPYWYIFFGVCLWIAAFGIIYKKIAEFAIILELNGYSGCMEIG